MALSVPEKQLLKVVIGVAGDNLTLIRDGIIKALRGENEHGRRNYLWHILERAATSKIRAARRKYDCLPK